MYGTPSPLARSLISLKGDEQFVKGREIIIINNIFLIIASYRVSILAAQYLYSGIFP